jgi:hypothetical protein
MARDPAENSFLRVGGGVEGHARGIDRDIGHGIGR